MRTGGEWYKGTADAIYKNINIIYDEKPKYVCVFGGDHVYKMDVRKMLDYHKEKGADLTISGIPMPIEDAPELGVMEIDNDWRLAGFQEKPKTNPKTIPGKADKVLASMGNYIFNADIILRELESDAGRESSHDFGKDIIANLYPQNKVFVYDFSRNFVAGMTEAEKGYWRDVGTIDAYLKANMDLLEVQPEFNLYNREWAIRTFNYNYPPAKFVWEESERVGMATNSLVAEGCVISGGHISKCVLSPNVRVNSFSYVQESILMEDVIIGRHAQIKKAIIDKYVNIPSGIKIGYDKGEDLARGFYVTDTGITVVPKGAII